MNAAGEQSKSLWMDTAKLPDFPPLKADAAADVIVVGSGIAGLSTAYELCKRGQSVIILDRGPIGGGMTSRTSAHLTSNIDDLYHELITLRGEEEARAYLKARLAAIDRIEEIQHIEAIDCDFQRVDGYLFPAKTDDVKTLEDELAACRTIGFRGVKWVDETPIPDAGSGRSLFFPNQARFHPRKYLAGLARAIKGGGGALFADSPVVGIEEKDGGVQVTTARKHVVTARAAVIATNSPINDWLAIHTKQAPYRTYVIAGAVPQGSVPDALYWDTLDPYHYVRIQPDAKHDWLIVGGEDHKTGESDDAGRRVAKLEAWARSLVPDLGEIKYQWSGQVLDPVDYLPFSGKNPGNEAIFIHTGDSGEGLTNGVIGSQILRDLVMGRKNRRASLLDPGRITAKAATRFLSENVAVAKNLAEHLTGGEVASADELQRGQAALIRDGVSKAAAYRDKKGKLHVRSAVCTHSGCVLHWNSFETCWDCTCHGSHFSVDGEPLNAPAVRPLAEASAGNNQVKAAS
ncbi:MAG TPA: FAD-dependent oxidoreductase [Phycisphaerae bacterium]|nr:FAD-dependent oxidoreductase [Phycisphaerae bacterium]